MKRHALPWRRILAEGAVIVGSILVAFAVDAWWDRSQAEDLERDFISALLEDMVQNRAEMETLLASHERSAAGFKSFLAATPAELADLPEDSAELMINQIWSAPTLDVIDVLQSADLGIVSSPELRRALGSWSARAADQAETRPAQIDAMRVLWESVAVVSPELLVLGPGNFGGSAATALGRLRGSETFVERAAVLQVLVVIDQGDVEALLEQTGTVLALASGHPM